MADKKVHKYGSEMIEGKEVPLTKSGLPNQVYLSKDAKVIVKDLEETLKASKKTATQKELSDLFKRLGLTK